VTQKYFWLFWVHNYRRNMMPITQKQIDAWIADDTRFEGKADGAGLMLRYRREDRRPVWRFRYRMSDGVQRQMTLGNIDKLPLSEARKIALA
jgi:hypothetical protein